MNNTYDLIVVGSGPGGARAAFVAAANGLKTAVIEAGFLGGTCLNAGCIPTKYLLGGTGFLPLLRRQCRCGVVTGEAGVDFNALQARKERFLKGTRLSLEKQFAAAGITLLRGRASFAGPREITVKGTDDGSYGFTKCILACGSVPAVYPGLKADSAAVLAPASVLNLKEVPESLLIVGGGAIGLELGELYHRLGSRITLVEVMPHLLAAEDESTSEFLRTLLTREGWTVHTGRKIASLATENNRAVLTFEDGERLEAARGMPAVGRRPNVSGLIPEAAGLRVRPNGWLETDDFLQTAETIYAVGDINGRTLLAHAADHQGEYAGLHAAGKTDLPYQPPAMPGCVYGSMEVMRVGPTVRELRRAGKRPLVSRAEAAANPILQACGHTQGFVKAVWADNVLQAIVAVCHDASHLITLSALLVASKLPHGELPDVIFAHPTLDECVRSALLAPIIEE